MNQMNLIVDMPPDAQRMDKAVSLIAVSKDARILSVHDIKTKQRMIKFGGQRYSHILNIILPNMKTKGISRVTTDKVAIQNHKTWLTYSQKHSVSEVVRIW
ncbi:Phosphotriesterase-related protein [Zootermopsis nevadensis]|uniref:Phosphotriesterase-related protein n=1 Tax=Zootermopsis nevadensis TaxID=136037 RepID=A0A067QIL8_ZOONE|nr:Phosphotriesterase-related protein [Zootermopsis nevadensis]